MLVKFNKYFENLSEKEIYTPWFLLFIGLVIFCNQAWVPGFFLDGMIYSALGKQASDLNTFIVPFLSNFGSENFQRFPDHPPLYVAYLGIMMKIFGSSWTVARLSGSIIAIFTLLTLFLGLKSLKGQRFAFIATTALLLTIPFIKKTRFPQMDYPLALFYLCTLLIYFKALTRNKLKYWIFAGILFGITLLIKGPPGIFLLPIIFLHLIFSKNYKKLFTVAPWLSLITGLLIFCLWPLTLWLNGNFDIFMYWCKSQVFGTIVLGRANQNIDFLFYVKVLFLEGFPWFHLALFGSYLAIKKKEPSSLLFLIWFWCIIIPFSFMRWKLSHYIIPAYPAMGYLAALTIEQLSERAKRYTFGTLKIVLYVGTLALLMLPLTINSKRSYDLLQIKKVVNLLPNKPTLWINVDNCLERWEFSSFVTFDTNSSPILSSTNQLNSFLTTNNHQVLHVNLEKIQKQQRALILINKKDILRITKNNINILKNRFTQIALIKNKNILLFLENKSTDPNEHLLNL